MVTCIEEITKDFIKEVFDFQAFTSAKFPGLWYEEHKLMSIGLRVEKGVTRHGIALNLSNDLGVYNYFEPCGMSGSVMTNVSKILNRAIECDEERGLQQSLADYIRVAFTQRERIRMLVQSD
jgi:lipoate-protein ligase B